MRTVLLACLGACTANVGPSGLPACLADIDTASAFEPAGEARGTRIQGRGAVDGSGAWLAWNEVDDDGTFDVWAAHVGCDGSTDLGPRLVSEVKGNAIDPALVVRDGEVLIAWQNDDGSSDGSNLSIRYRVLGIDGEPTTPALVVPIAGNAWMPDVAATDDGFVLVGAAGVDNSFRVFRHAMNADGSLRGTSTFIGRGGADNFETQPDVAVDAEGGVWIAYDDQVGEDGREAVLVSPDGSIQAWDGAMPRVSAWDDQVWAAFARADGTVAVVPPGGDPVGLSVGDVPDVAIDVAAGPAGADALELSSLGGLDHRVRVVGVDGAGRQLAKRGMGTDAAPPYPPHLDRADEATVLAVWHEGDSPTFALKARFVRLQGATP